jgi:hypothetical protein
MIAGRSRDLPSESSWYCNRRSGLALVVSRPDLRLKY